MKKARLTLDVSMDLKRKFQRACRQIDSDMSHVLRDFIRSWLVEQELNPTYFSRQKKRRNA